MQEMTPTVCYKAITGSSGVLEDIRDGQQYLVAKLRDNNCWMTQNLQIINRTIDSYTSDILSGTFTIPDSDKSDFNSANANKPKAYIDPVYGGYYNWYTATAGSTIVTGNSDQSICPKGWTLPLNSGNKSFMQLLEGFTTANEVTIAPYYFMKGGFIDGNSVIFDNSQGYYWTSGAISGGAINIIIIDTPISLLNNGPSIRGMSVRCVAR